MARRKLEPGSHGEISYQETPDGRVHATIRFRRLDGTHGRLRTRAASKAQARRTLLEPVREEHEAVHVAPGGLTRDSSFIGFDGVWLIAGELALSAAGMLLRRSRS